MIIPQSGPGRPPSSDAYEVADAWQLGVPLAEYQAAPAGFCALLLASIGIFIALVVWAALSFSIFALLLAGLAAVAILGIWGALRECYKDCRRGFCERFSCTEGLVRLKNAQRDVLRWDEIERVWRLISQEGESGPSLVGYLVQRKDASEFKLRGSDVAGMRNLGAAIEGAATRVLLPDGITRYRLGEMALLGPLGVNPGGVWVDDKQLPWGKIGSIDVKESTIQIKKQRRWLNWATGSVKVVPNVAIFATLVESIRSDQV